jgi:hypothetical protein
MNLMEFKIALIGQKLYGDLSLISNSVANQNNQTEKGFKDDRLL